MLFNAVSAIQDEKKEFLFYFYYFFNSAAGLAKKKKKEEVIMILILYFIHELLPIINDFVVLFTWSDVRSEEKDIKRTNFVLP